MVSQTQAHPHLGDYLEAIVLLTKQFLSAHQSLLQAFVSGTVGGPAYQPHSTASLAGRRGQQEVLQCSPAWCFHLHPAPQLVVRPSPKDTGGGSYIVYT